MLDHVTAVPKPEKQQKAAAKGLSRSGGRKPKEAGRRFEQRMVDKYTEAKSPLPCPNCGQLPLVYVKRQVGSGAFGKADPDLVGDLLLNIGRLRLLAEAKSWNKTLASGEKTINVPASVLYKLDQEARQLGRDPIGLFHMKNDTEEWAFVRLDWLINNLREWERCIRDLDQQLEEALAA